MDPSTDDRPHHGTERAEFRNGGGPWARVHGATAFGFASAVLLLLAGMAWAAPQPQIQAERDTLNRVVLRWSATSAVIVESAPQVGSAANWTPIPEPLSPSDRTVTLIPTDLTRFFRVRITEPLVRVAKTSPQPGEQGISVLREAVLNFSDALPEPATLSISNFFAETNGRRLLGRVELAADRRSATLFYQEPVPGNSRVRVQLNSDDFAPQAAALVDFDGNAIPGGTFSMVYGTHANSASDGTAISGRVFAAERVRDASGNLVDHPLANVTVSVDGADERLRTVTDLSGNFRLEPCPAGRFFVHIDGRTATESHWPSGAYYPVVGKSWFAVQGRKDNVANDNGEVFLPLIPQGTLQPTSLSEPTTISLPASVIAANPEWAGIEVVVPPGSLYSESGSRGGMVGLSIVPADRLPSPLPEGLRLPVVITVQTDGPQNFTEPVRARFPNLPDPITGKVLAPGEQTALWSFNHDSGQWEVQGPATVTGDGKFVESDRGFGIRQPGWHGVAPGVPASTPPPTLPCSSWSWVDILDALDQNRQAVAGTAAETLAFQLYCIAAQAAQNSGTWGQGWVMEVLQGIACNSRNGTLQDAAQYPCGLVPGGVPIFTSTTAIPPHVYFNTLFTGDLCFAIEGFGYHTLFELLPGFWEHICQMSDSQHNDFIQHGILPCLAGNPALGPTMTSVASTTVPPILAAVRETMQALASCDDPPGQGNPQLSGAPPRAVSLPALPAGPTEAELRIPELDAANTLQVDRGGRFFISVGESVQLKVIRNGADITRDPATRYSAFVGAGSATVTADGIVTVHSTSNSLPVITPTFYIAIWNGTNTAMAQFAMKDVDTDGDGMVDAYERSVGLDPLVANSRGTDSDQDDMSDFDEAMLRTSPTLADTDGDGISDSEERAKRWDPIHASSPSEGEKVARGPYYSWIQDLELDWDARAFAPSADQGLPDQILAPARKYRRWIYSPSDDRRGSIEFVSTGMGTSMVLPQPTLHPGNSPDSDQDGLDDEAEAIVGTNARVADTDSDGVNDFNEIRQGRDPLSQQGRPVGFIATLPLSGTAQGLLRQGNLAYLSVGPPGVAVVDVADPEKPRLVSQLDLSGSSFGVAISRSHRVAAVAASSETVIGPDYGVHLVDVSDPGAMRFIRTIPLPIQTLTERDGQFIVGLRKEVRILDAATGAEMGWAATQSDVLGVTAAGGRLYVATQQGLEIFDATVPDPIRLGLTNTPNTLVSRFFEGDMIVSRGVLHAGTGSGYLTMDVSDPEHPVQLALSRRTPAWIMHGLALNGSGKMASLVSFGGGARDLSLFDATNPEDADRFLTSFRTQGPAHDLDFMSGLVLVADARSGLSIFNTTGADTRGIAPTVTADFAALDQDPNRPGIQVFAGATLEVEAEIRDDLQMREASLWVNGERSATRDSGPVVFSLDVPATIPSSGSVQVQVQAVDFGGSVGQTLPTSLEVVLRPQGPILLASYPKPDGAMAASAPLIFSYDQLLRTNAIDPTLAHLLDLGADGIEGSGDDTRLPVSSVEAVGRLLYVQPSAALRSAFYSLVIAADAVSNRAGTAAGQGVRMRFAARPAGMDDAIWVSPTGGSFHAPTNWANHRVPFGERVFIPAASDHAEVNFTAQDYELQRLEHFAPLVLMPGAELSIAENWVGHSAVTISNALVVLKAAGEFHAPVELSGGRWINLGTATFHWSLNATRGAEFFLDGPAARLDPPTAFAGRSFTFTARNAATARLPQFAEFTDPGDFALFLPRSSSFVATGAGSRIELPELTEVRGPVNWSVRSVPSLTLQAIDGGNLDLPRLRFARDRVLFRASERSASILAPSLELISGPQSDFPASVNVSSTGKLQLAGRALIERCTVALGTGGTIQCATLELGEAATVSGSGTLVGSLIGGLGKLSLSGLEQPLVIEGDLELTSTSATEVTIGRWTSDLRAGRLSVLGAATLGGTLKIVIPRGLQLSAGEEYTFANFAAAPSGDFASLDDSGLGTELKAERVGTTTELKLRISAR